MQKINKTFLQQLAKSLFFELDDDQLAELAVEFNVVLAQMDIIQQISTENIPAQAYCNDYCHRIEELKNYPVPQSPSKIISTERVDSENQLVLPNLKSNDD